MGQLKRNMSLTHLLVFSAVIALAYSAQDQWSETTKIPVKKPILDQRMSHIVPGALRNSLAEKKHTGELQVALTSIADVADITESDDDLQLAFTVFNPTDAPIKMCARDTPIEGPKGGIISNLFVVQNPAGKVMDYRGVDAKRTEAPDESEIITIGAGESLTEVITLSDYSLTGDGAYYIRVKQPIDEHILYKDVMRTQVKITITGAKAHEARWQSVIDARESESSQILLESKVGAISANGCTTSEMNILRGWHEDAVHKIDSARACTESSCRAQVDTWFGAQTTQAQFAAGATAQFNTMKAVEMNTIYRCQSGNSNMARLACKGYTYAYVYPTDRGQNVYICDFTFNYPDYSEKVQTVIHELSHFNHIGRTDDLSYGETPGINFAQSNFQAAIRTADNMGYFAKYANRCYRNAPSGYVPKNSPLLGCVDRIAGCQATVAKDWPAKEARKNNWLPGWFGGGKAGKAIGCTAATRANCCQSCTGGQASNDCSDIWG